MDLIGLVSTKTCAVSLFRQCHLRRQYENRYRVAIVSCNNVFISQAQISSTLQTF